MTLIFHSFDVPKPSLDPARAVGRTGVEKGRPGMLRRVARSDCGGRGWVTVMVGMWEGGRSPFYILQLPINRPMAALLVVAVVVVVDVVVAVITVVKLSIIKMEL